MDSPTRTVFFEKPLKQALEVTVSVATRVQTEGCFPIAVQPESKSPTFLHQRRT